MKDEEFVCLNCGSKVSKLNYTARDHCNNCLYSIHVDINPGDRLNDCKGTLVPIGIENLKILIRLFISVIIVVKYIRILWQLMIIWMLL